MNEMKVRLGDYADYNLYNQYTWALRCSLSYTSICDAATCHTC